MRGEIPPLEQTISGLADRPAAGGGGDLPAALREFPIVRLALAIVLTVPAVLCGVLLMLLATGTTLNIQSFMGAIMAIGIAVANSILLVTFAERARHENGPSLDAAREGAGSRLRADADDRRRDDLRHAARWPSDSAKAARKPRRWAAPSSAVCWFHLRDADDPAFDLRHSAAAGRP